ncbi:RCC1 and BTB domain-containing protein 1 [Cyphomyrmex costatus]|uniref:RCC1 and BTB domain-containing protein 1 n=1 Tax=Cyphomyrmex costatus TaxID=456900 RepID=A0A195CUM9_9HYME|nr:RCC1 and BTB domain-containing protein 1 [Cyphomyrmex costatus]
MSADLCSWPIVSSLEPEFVKQIYMVMVYKLNGDYSNALILTKDKMVYVLQENSDFCAEDEFSTIYSPKKIETLCTKKIKSFAYGDGCNLLALTEGGESLHLFCKLVLTVLFILCLEIAVDKALIVTKDKMVYVLGTNRDGCLETGDTLPTLNPKKVEALCMKDIKKLRAEKNYPKRLNLSLLIFLSFVYAWGLHHVQEFDEHIDVENESVDTPMRLDSLRGKKVVYIACGATFTIVVMDNGNVYSWGINRYGQLDVGDERDRLMPCQLNSLKGIVIVKVACGYAHTLALTDEGNLYTWGLNEDGQLGIGNTTNSSKPVMVKHQMGRVFDIAADYCKHISIAVNKEGRVYITTRLHLYTVPHVMHEPLILNANEESEILKDLKIAFDNPLTSDFTIQVESKCIHVHKAILKIRSSYFRMMFQHVWSKNNQSVIQHDQYSYKVYKAFLNYLYTDVIDLPWEQTVELFILADAYCEDSLKKRCTKILKHKITVSNVTYLYSIATKYNNKELEEVCTKFAFFYLTSLEQIKNDDKEYQNVIKDLILKAREKGGFKMYTPLPLKNKTPLRE